jgi:hypothetical protein
MNYILIVAIEFLVTFIGIALFVIYKNHQA